MTLAERLRREGKQEGMQQGMQEGVQQGAELKQREIARTMLVNGLDESMVARMTGLSYEVVRGLSEETTH